MGLSLSPIQNTIPISSDWTEIGHATNIKLFQNSQGEIAQQHIYALDHNKTLEQQIEIFTYRKHQRLNLVKIHGVQIRNSNQSCCGDGKYLRVLVEHFDYRLTNITSYSFEEALFIFSSVIHGCRDILQKVGAIIFEDAMFGITKEGFIKVWVNPNFQYNHPATLHQLHLSPVENQRTMTLSLLKVVEEHLREKKFSSEFVGQLYSLNDLTLVGFQRYLQKYADVHQIIIPDRLFLSQSIQRQSFQREVPIQKVHTQIVAQKKQDIGTLTLNNVYEPSRIINQNITQTKTLQYMPLNSYVPQQITSNTVLKRQIRYQSPVTLPSFPHEFSSFQNQMSNQSFVKNKGSFDSILTTDQISSIRSVKPQYDLFSQPIATPPIPMVHHSNLTYLNSNSLPSVVNKVNVPLDNRFSNILTSTNTFNNTLHSELQSSLYQKPLERVLPQIQTRYKAFSPERHLIPNNNIPVINNIPALYSYPLSQNISLPIISDLKQVNSTNYIHQSHQNAPVITKTRQQDMYLTTTTYQINPKVTYQYRTTHPESVKVISDNRYNPVVTVNKLTNNRSDQILNNERNPQNF